MHYRDLGHTDLRVSEIGLGCNRLGEDTMPMAHWRDIVARAVDLGATLFDTAEGYGGGRSEVVLGDVLGNRADVHIASKVAPGPDGFTRARMEEYTHAALKRLRRDCIDIFQLHSPSWEALERDEWIEVMDDLQRAGKIRVKAMAVGPLEQAAWLMERDLVQAVQLTYNVFEREPEREVFPMAVERGVGVLVRMPLARGVLTGKFRPDSGIPEENRASLDGEHGVKRLPRVEELRKHFESHLGGLTRAAHQFAITPPAVSSSIPGARTMEQLSENTAASNGSGLDPAALAMMRSL